METFPTSSSSLNGNGHSNGFSNYGNSATVSSSPAQSNAGPIPIEASAPSLLSAWQLQAQQEEETDLRNLLSVIRRRAWVIAGVAAVTMALVAGHTIRQKEIFQGQFRVLVEPVNADDDFSELTSVLGQQNLGKSGLDYETQVQVLRSPELVEPIAEQLQQSYPELGYLKLLENLRITRLGDTKIF